MSADAPPVVFNCNVFLQAIISEHGPARRCYHLAEEDRITLHVDAYVLYELRNLPYRVKAKRFRTVTPERIERFIRELLLKSVLVSEVPVVFTYPRDPDDANYVNLAAAVGARFIVTRDFDLLALMDTRTAEGRDFQRRFPNLRIVDPVQFLAEVAPA